MLSYGFYLDTFTVTDLVCRNVKSVYRKQTKKKKKQRYRVRRLVFSTLQRLDFVYIMLLFALHRAEAFGRSRKRGKPRLSPRRDYGDVREEPGCKFTERPWQRRLFTVETAIVPRARGILLHSVRKRKRDASTGAR